MLRVGIYADVLRCLGSGRRYLRGLLKGFKKTGHKIRVFLISFEPFEEYAPADEFVLLEDPTIGKIFKPVLRASAVKGLVDVVHVPDMFMGNLPSLPDLTFLDNLVITLHGISPLAIPWQFHYESFFDYLKWRVGTYVPSCGKQWLLRVMKRKYLVVAPSCSERENILRNISFPASKVRVILHGVDHEVFKPMKNCHGIAQEYGLEKYILQVCDYQPRKNTETLVRAFSIVKRNFGKNGLKLVIVGSKGKSWHERARITRAVQETGLKKDVIHLGRVSLEHLVALYNCAEGFVFPSLHEGFGFPVLESMACGCPVIASNTYSLPEIVEDAGILVNPLNVRDLANAIIRVLKNDEMREFLRNKCLERARMFTWENTAKEYFSVYRELSCGS